MASKGAKDTFKFLTNINQSRICVKEVENGLKYWKTNYVLHCHLVFFGLILAMFLRSQSYDFVVTAHTGALLGVELLY